MAKPIEMKPVARPAEEQTRRALENAPVQHADAVLASYEVLQQLHDTGTLDLLRGLLGAGDHVVNHVVELSTQPEVVRGLRNLVALGKLLGNVEPDALHALTEARAASGEAEPPSLFALLRRARSPRSRRGLAVAVGLLEALGTPPRGK